MKNFQLLLIGILIFSCDFNKEYVATNPEDDAKFIVENYNKTEVYIPMRDGTRLFTSIYTPKNKSEKYPILMNRTPYGVKPYGTSQKQYKNNLGPSMRLTRDFYIYV